MNKRNLPAIIYPDIRHRSVVAHAFVGIIPTLRKMFLLIRGFLLISALTAEFIKISDNEQASDVLLDEIQELIEKHTK